MLSLVFALTLSATVSADGLQLGPTDPDPIGFISASGSFENPSEIEGAALEAERGFEVFEKTNGPARRVMGPALIGDCEHGLCSRFYVFGEEPGWILLRERSGVPAWRKLRAGQKITAIESEYSNLVQQAQHLTLMAKEPAGALESIKSDTIFHPLPPRLIFSHGLLSKRIPGQKSKILKAYSEAKGSGDSLEFDWLGDSYIRHEVQWDRSQLTRTTTFVREIDGEWLKIQFKPNAPLNGRAMWVKHDPDIMGELRPMSRDQMERALINAGIELPIYMETPVLKFVGSKRIDARLWFEVELWSHKNPTLEGQKIDDNSENPSLRTPKLIRKGWMPYRNEKGGINIDIYEGC